MFVPHYYNNEDAEEVKNFLAENSFGILISQGNGRVAGTHIPLELDKDKDGNDVLLGHIAKANPQATALVDGLDVLAIFNGPHAYISSSWYEQQGVPTWNYVAVHVYGEVKIIEGEALVESLKRLVDKYEDGRPNRVSVEPMSDKDMRQVHGIVGFSIKIKEIQAAYKLSQNRNERDHKNIVNQLFNTEDSNAKAIAKLMSTSKKE